jgi:NAD(P)-dependent dehydrogenase (short-subunit alcohol dehydrogenase family)
MSALSALHGATTTVFSNLFVKLPIPHATPELPRQTIIVTGSNTGLGLETSRHLLRLGLGKLIMAVRNLDKGQQAKQELLASTGRDEASVEVWLLDMDSHDSVKKFASRASQLPRLDGVLANAGIMTKQFSTSEGHEKTLNVNVISTFLLCLLLIPKMRESEKQTGWPCRFVIPNSALHYLAPMGELDIESDPDLDIIARLDDPAKADMAGRYPLSKLLVLYAVRELADRCKASEKGVFIVNTPNPSYCVSNLARESEGVRGVKTAEKLLARTTEEGSRTLYHGLFASQESNGKYLTNCHVQT